MQTTSAPFDAQVVGQDQQVAWQVIIGLPASVNIAGVDTPIPATWGDLSGAVVGIQVERSLTTTAPDGTLQINGYPSAQATVTLAGPLAQAPGVASNSDQTAYWLFNPNDDTSLMYRQKRGGLPITIKQGLWVGDTTPELVTIFTGTIDESDCSNGTVTLTCLDARSLITGEATLPPVVTDPPYNAGLTSSFAVDYLLRHASPGQFYSWPAQRAHCVLAAGMRSSAWPEVGAADPTDLATPGFAQGAYGPALISTDITGLSFSPCVPIDPTQSVFIEWIGVLGGSTQGVTVLRGDGHGGQDTDIGIFADSGGVGIVASDPSGGAASGGFGPGGTLSAGPHYFAAQFTWAPGSPTITGTGYVDGASFSFSLTGATRSASASFNHVRVDIGDGTMEGVQVTVETAGASNGAFVPTAILDPSLNPLTALPDVAGKDTWTVLQDIASAESAVLGFDELGVFRFTNRDTIKSGVSQRDVTSTASLVSLETLEQMSTVATHIEVPVNQVQISAPTTVWAANQVYEVPASGNLVLFVTTQYPVLSLATDDLGFYPISGAVAGGTYWRADTQTDGLGIAIISGISVHVDQLSSTRLKITVSNANPYPVQLANPTGYAGGNPGDPLLYIGGQSVAPVTTPIDGTTGAPSDVIADAQWPPENEGGAKTNAEFGEILLPVSANDWIQDLPAGEAFADALLLDLYRGRPLYRSVTIVADPRVQLVDHVTLIDPDISQTNVEVLIVGINTVLDANTWAQDIDARAVSYPGGWILGLAGSSELGVDTYL